MYGPNLLLNNELHRATHTGWVIKTNNLELNQTDYSLVDHL